MARKKGVQVEQAYEYIKNKILSLELYPGTPISDNALSLEIEMSRSPVREAVMLLISDGLVEVKDRRTQVAGMTLDDIVEICQVREAVEVAAINIISDNGGLSDEQKETLSGVFCKLQAAGELKETYFYDDLFHGTIMEFSKNKRLMDISYKMRLQIARARWLNAVLPDRKTEAAREHEAIYSSLLENDCEGSVGSLRSHLMSSAENFKKVLNDPRYNLAFTRAVISFSGGNAQNGDSSEK